MYDNTPDGEPPKAEKTVFDNTSFEDMLRVPHRFSELSKLILQDLNNNTSSPSFFLYSKDDIVRFLRDPFKNEKHIRAAVTYIYGASVHFRRLIQYFSSLSDLAYVVAPYKIDVNTANQKSVRRNFNKTLNLLSLMDIRNQFSKVITVCLREDVYYGTMRVSPSSIVLQQLPSDFCAIEVVEDNVPNVSFDFSYFDKYSRYLPMYSEEFQQKYEIYKNDRTGKRWQELASPTSFAVKFNNDILTYAMPPFAGLLREIYDIEDYKQLKKAKTELENYAMLVMHLGLNSDGEWELDYNKAVEIWRNLDNILPEEIGSILTPMPIDKISFERTHTGDTNTIAEAEQNLFTAAGVPSLLFNSDKSSANALNLSIKVDQALTFSIVKSIENVINRFIHAQSFGKYFRMTFLDCSPFNRKELGDAYIKACSYGLPMLSYYCASQGLSQLEMNTMNFLENDVLNLVERFKPLQNSATLSADSTAEVGRAKKEDTELTEQGEQTREDA